MRSAATAGSARQQNTIDAKVVKPRFGFMAGVAPGEIHVFRTRVRYESKSFPIVRRTAGMINDTPFPNQKVRVRCHASSAMYTPSLAPIVRREGGYRLKFKVPMPKQVGRARQTFRSAHFIQVGA